MILLITGCVNVSTKTPFVTVRNYDERLKQYLQTIEWAAKESPFDIIVFCENSNCDFDFEKYFDGFRCRNKKFEYLSFWGDKTECDKFGKGYGEGEIIKYAVENSKYIKKNSCFYKITGKLWISNINQIICDDDLSHFMRYCDRVGKVDTKFYKLMLRDYNKGLMDAFYQVNDNKKEFLEKVYYDTMRKNNIKYKSFSVLPIVEGVSGTTGKEYKHMSNKRKALYNMFCKFGVYNYGWMAYLDWIFNKIAF